MAHSSRPSPPRRTPLARVETNFEPDSSLARALSDTNSLPSSPSQGDPRLAPFLSDDFDVTAYASEMLASGTVQAATSALDGGIDALDFALKSEVRAHYDDLLAQLGGMDEADRVLEIVRGGVHALQDTMGRVREEIVEPHRTVSAKTRQLENITRTVDVLHRVVRVPEALAATERDHARHRVRRRRHRLRR